MRATVIVITKNSEGAIGRCLESVRTLVESTKGEILVVDGGSTDRTVEIAKRHGARVVEQTGDNYSAWRNQGLAESKSDWIFYLDSDEEVSQELSNEISQLVTSHELLVTAFAIPRRNIIFGREMKHGGWWPDYVKRLFKKDTLKRWEGKLHEEPVVEVEDPERSRRDEDPERSRRSELGHLKNPIIHHKHEHVSEMIEKTNKWSEIEAKLLFDAGHPQMTWWRFFRIVKTEFLYRYVLKLGFLDGTAGAVYALYQAFSRFITYTKLWEMQKEKKARQSQ